MENELNLVKDIIIELSGLGGWAIFAYVVFMLMKAVVVWWPVFWLVHKIIVKVSHHYSQPLTLAKKNELEESIKVLTKKVSDYKEELDAALRDKQMTLHQYKIMKDALDKNKEE